MIVEGPNATPQGDWEKQAVQEQNRWVSRRIRKANEQQRVSHASGVGRRGPRERECRGVRGAKPLGKEKDASYARASIARSAF